MYSAVVGFHRDERARDKTLRYADEKSELCRTRSMSRPSEKVNLTISCSRCVVVNIKPGVPKI